MASTVSPSYEPIAGGSYAYIAGWGSTRNEDEDLSLWQASMSDVLNFIEVEVKGRNRCRKLYGFGNFKVYQMCADGFSLHRKTSWVIGIKSCLSVYLLNQKL